MIARTAAAAAMLCLLAAVPAKAATMSDWATPEMKQVLTELDVKISDSGTLDDGDPYVSGVAPDSGLKFTVYGTACTGDGAKRRCQGAELSTSFTLDNAAAVEKKVKELDYAAVSIFASKDADDPALQVTRYVIFDNGIERENLKSNITVFLSIAEEIWDKL